MSIPSLVAGANAVVPQEKLTLEMTLSPLQLNGVEVDISAFVLTASGKVRGDDDMVFYGQTRPGNGSVALTSISVGSAEFCVDLPNVSSDVEKIAFTATIHENRQNFTVFNRLNVALKNSRGEVFLEVVFPASDMMVSALIMGELYRRQGQWKFRAVGQGFVGGLTRLAEHFGVDVSDAHEPITVPPPLVTVGNPVALSQLTLDRARPKVSLDKKAEGFGQIKVKLNWNRSSTSPNSSGLLGGLLSRGNKNADLKMGCLYEMQDGLIGVIQALGNHLGAFNSDPFIELQNENYSEVTPESECLRINGQYWQRFKRILLFTFIEKSSPNWAQVEGVVTLYVPNEPPLEIRLTEGVKDMSLCATVLLENREGALLVSREVRYFRGHQLMGKAYQWGLNWEAG